MVAIKDFEMPSCCGECQLASCIGLSGHFYCDITTYDVDMDDTERDADCPLVEAIPKVNVYKAIQEMMKYEHEGFINISLARLDEILKKCGVSEDATDRCRQSNK